MSQSFPTDQAQILMDFQNHWAIRAMVVAFIRKQGRAPNREQSLEITTRRERLLRQMAEFHKAAGKLFLSLDVENFTCGTPPMSDGYITDGEVTDKNFAPPPDPSGPERRDIFLPSTVSNRNQDLPPCLIAARNKEIKLRIAQAEEALEGIRHEIGHKSYLYRKDIRLAESTAQKTRGYSAVHAADRSLKQHLRVYEQAKWALKKLGAAKTVLQRFQDILPEHTVALTSIYKPNDRGHRSDCLPWFWKMDVAGDSMTSEYMDECQHNHSLTTSIPLADQLTSVPR